MNQLGITFWAKGRFPGKFFFRVFIFICCHYHNAYNYRVCGSGLLFNNKYITIKKKLTKI